MNYCSNCGNALNSGDRFCPSCGTKVGSTVLNSSATAKFSHKFTSKILLGGNILAPDKILIDQTGVTYSKRNKYLIGTDESSIPFSRISSVEIDRKLIDSDIIIYSTGNQTIIAGDFSIGDAKKIKKIIEERI